MNNIHWHTKSFEELTNEELYGILQLRSDVFIVEQQCPYPDLDAKDLRCLHVFATFGPKIIACSRIVPPGLSYPQMSIGRVAVCKEFRQKKLGKVLMDFTLEKIDQEFGAQDIQIGAQVYLKKFYGSFGFEPVSLDYDEDGIMHVDMLRKLNCII
ncbi:GNAT family N-acetyltransferase [Myroides sp. LJL115]